MAVKKKTAPKKKTTEKGASSSLPRKKATRKKTGTPRKRGDRKELTPSAKQAALVEPEHPWERQVGESDEAWLGFQIYRDLGPGNRTLKKVSLQLGKTDVIVHRHSSRWEWIARARLWDGYKDKQEKLAEIEAVKEMKKRHIHMAMNFQGAAALALKKVIKAEQDGTQLTLKPNEIRDLADLGMRIERLNRGEPESIEEHRHELEATDKRAELRKLLEGEKMSLTVQQLTDAILNGTGR